MNQLNYIIFQVIRFQIETMNIFLYLFLFFESHTIDNIIKAEGRFTNMAVPRFNGGGCWQHHLQIVQAIVKKNGWTDGTAALQLFAHLDG